MNKQMASFIGEPPKVKFLSDKEMKKIMKQKKDWKKIVTNTCLIFILFYMVWHMGRWFEFKQLGQGVNAYYFEKPMMVDPILNTTKDIYIKGTVKVGVCYE